VAAEADMMGVFSKKVWDKNGNVAGSDTSWQTTYDTGYSTNNTAGL
jgi:hypothetical protein